MPQSTIPTSHAAVNAGKPAVELQARVEELTRRLARTEMIVADLLGELIAARGRPGPQRRHLSSVTPAG